MPGWATKRPGKFVFTHRRAQDLDARADLIKRFLTALRCGLADDDAFTGPDGTRQDQPTAAATLTIMAKHLHQPPDELGAEPFPASTPRHGLDFADMEHQLAWFTQQNMLKGDVKLDQVVDRRFASRTFDTRNATEAFDGRYARRDRQHGRRQSAQRQALGAQTQRSLEYLSIGAELIPREMITAYGILKRAAATANYDGKRLDDRRHALIVQACDEILAGKHHDMFPLHVWMTGSGTQFNMNINEVIANRCSQLAGTPLGSKQPVHPNDHVNASQSSNDTFPSAMYIAAALGTKQRLIPAIALAARCARRSAQAWQDIKIGRTHLQDATPLTLGQEFSGYVGMLSDNLARLEAALSDVYALALGGTAVGTGLNAAPGFADAACAETPSSPACLLSRRPTTPCRARMTRWCSLGTLRTLAVSLFKIAVDIRLPACGPRAGFAELDLPENEPGLSIMPGKVNPTQCEALTMIAVQVMANDVAVGIGGGGGYLEMNVYKPLDDLQHHAVDRLMSDGSTSFRKILAQYVA